MYTLENYRDELPKNQVLIRKKAEEIDFRWNEHREKVRGYGEADPEDRLWMNQDLDFLRPPSEDSGPYLSSLGNPYFLHCKDPYDHEYYYISSNIGRVSNILRYTEARASYIRYRGNERNKLNIESGRIISFESDREESDKIAHDDTVVKSKDVQSRKTIGNISSSLFSEQDEAMRGDHSKNLLISGPAGSGKTNALLHRMDYLIHESGFDLGDIALFCFNVGLKKYLLDSAEQIVRGTPNIYSVDKWSMDLLNEVSRTRLGIDYKYSVDVDWDKLNGFINKNHSNDVLFRLLSGIVERLGDNRNLRNGWEKDLEERVKFLIENGCGKIECCLRLRIPLIDEILRSKKLPLHGEESDKRKERLMNQVNDEIKEMINQLWHFGGFHVKGFAIKADSLNKSWVDFSGLWSDYCNWIGVEYSESQLSAREVHFALIYLSRKILNDAIGRLKMDESGGNKSLPLILRRYSHVMVDEFQDLEKYQLQTIASLSDGGLSLAGDITQSIFRNPTDGNFDFGFKIDTVSKLEITHRSTLQTIRFANALLSKNVNYNQSEKTTSSGYRPMVIVSNGTDEFFDYLKAQLSKHPKSNFLIACPSKVSSASYNEAMRNHGIDSYVGEKDAWDFSKQLHVATFHQVKGLEFDFVYVMDLGSYLEYQNFTNQENVLYTVFTRPKDRLNIVFFNDIPKSFTSKIGEELYDTIEL